MDGSPGRCRRSKAFDTREQAWNFLGSRRQAEVPLSDHPRNFTAVSWSWLLTQQQVSASTYRGYESLILGHLNPAANNRTLEELRATWWSKQFTYGKLQGKSVPGGRPQPKGYGAKLSPQKTRECLRIGHKIYGYAMTMDPPLYVGINPLDPALTKRPVVPPSNFQPLEDEELLAILDEIPEFFGMLTYTLISLGLRLSEALALQHSDYSASERKLYIQRTVKTGEPTPFGLPKSNRGIRDLRVSEDFHRRLMAQQQRVELMPANPYDLIFPSKTGTVLNRSNYHRMFVAAVKRAGVKRRVRVHDLRHTFAARQRRGSEGNPRVSAEVLSARMGHASVGFTLTTYRRLFKAELDTPVDSPLVAANTPM